MFIGGWGGGKEKEFFLQSFPRVERRRGKGDNTKQLVDEKRPKARGVSASVAKCQISAPPNQSILPCPDRNAGSHPFENNMNCKINEKKTKK